MINCSIQKTKDVAHFDALIRLFEEVFEMKDFVMPPADHLERLLARDDFFVFVVLRDGEVIGGLTSYTLRQYYSTSPLVYIYDLAVATAYQRKGIGKMLIAAIQNYCKNIGVEEVFVQADVADDYALDFYRSTGATGEDVVHFYYPLKS
ncbi:ribosomal protein S18 acetylase RimI-like enzyme [Pedobacter sp. AK017]|uniref:GNAT family N-acetyltransferase n=1 Tax=Pedobacter sp. AK017 TaxID=2723073 RepID=UPI0016098A46|nr:GNAT family N-acetyltransferase [Pedobacter sp. AK017]MBB5437978.1 ribosomal protein S18 acetylase RimI-like enzyme [Pedobacter sp. AK017]